MASDKKRIRKRQMYTLHPDAIKKLERLSSLNGDRSASRTLENLIMDAQIQDDVGQPPTGE